MILNFNKINIKGFLSIEEAEIDLSNQGIVYVKGENHSLGSQSSNGAGKSTIFEAIIYVLTGKTLRGTTEVVNKYSKLGYTEVTLDLNVDNDNYTIKRTKNHPKLKNNLKIIKNDKDISGDKLKKSESILETELPNLNLDLISNVIILGQGLPNKFTDLRPLGRKERLEELSQTSKFIDELKVRLSKFIDKNKDDLQETNIEITKLETENNINEESVRTKTQELNDLKEKLSNISDRSNELNDLKEKLNKLNNDISQEKENQSNYNKSLNKKKECIFNFEMQKSTLENKINECNNKLNSIKNKTCPTCGQPLKNKSYIENYKVNLQKELKIYKPKIKSLIELINTKNIIIDEYNKKLDEINENLTNKQSEWNKLQNNISEILSEQKFNDKQIDSLQNEINKSVSKVESNRIELKKKYKTLSTQQNIDGILDYLNKKSSKEFRSYLLIGVVQYLNTKLQYYGEKLFGIDRLKLILDKNKIYIEYDNRPYENLSGGEKQRADLAMQFSLRDLLINSMGFSCNLLVIDEGFDNLDESGVNSLINCITNMNTVDSIFVISHHTLSIPFDKTLTVIKNESNISEVK